MNAPDRAAMISAMVDFRNSLYEIAKHGQLKQLKDLVPTMSQLRPLFKSYGYSYTGKDICEAALYRLSTLATKIEFQEWKQRDDNMGVRDDFIVLNDFYIEDVQ